MKPTELHTLFTDKEQTLLVATERERLTGLAEDDLDELLTLVRRLATSTRSSIAASRPTS